MSVENISDKREVWIDNIKVLACILVVIGHFFMSMVLCQDLVQIKMRSSAC